jgi:hypothetical protein
MPDCWKRGRNPVLSRLFCDRFRLSRLFRDRIRLSRLLCDKAACSRKLFIRPDTVTSNLLTRLSVERALDPMIF